MINAQVTEGRVDFFIREFPDGRREYEVIYQNGRHRTTEQKKRRTAPTESDAAEIIAALHAWIGSPRTGLLYTTEVPSWD